MTGPRVVWLFSMTRSGSSAVVYASARALGWAVADEPFGPWDRTGPPYHYPPEQVELHRAHYDRGERLTPETVRLAEKVLAQIAQNQRSDTIIIKMPHAMVEPRDVAEFWPSHRAAFLARNPLARLNSISTRGWTDTILPPYDLERVRLFIHRYTHQPRTRRFTFDEFTQTPRRFFRRLWAAWGAAFTEEQVELAVRYKANTYHESSGETIEGRNPHRVLSEHRSDVPAEAVRMYLDDPVIGAFLRRMGWEDSAAKYLAGQGHG